MEGRQPITGRPRYHQTYTLTDDLVKGVTGYGQTGVAGEEEKQLNRPTERRAQEREADQQADIHSRRSIGRQTKSAVHRGKQKDRQMDIVEEHRKTYQGSLTERKA